MARMGERRGAYRDLMGRPEGKRPLGIPSQRWEILIKPLLNKSLWEAWSALA